jgi:hypothetical protein
MAKLDRLLRARQGHAGTDDPDAPVGAADLAARRRLEEAFAPWRRSVHRRLLLRAALDGLTVGSLLGAGTAAAAHLAHQPQWRASGLALAAIGSMAFAARGARRAWTDEQVALFVDGVLETPESVTSAIALGAAAPREVVAAAIEALEHGPRRAPPRARRVHALALAGTVACVAILAVRAPKPAQASGPTGTEVVKLAQVPGLDKVAEVEKLPAKDDAQKERLAKIAEEARELKKKLLEGMPRREALDKLNGLRDRIENERLASGSHAALDAAAQALKASGFPGLADALEDRDLQGFDEMMERIANAREDQDRAKARDALSKAIEEARKKGAEDLAKALERQKAKLDARADKGDVLRELADALKGAPGDHGAKSKSFEDKATDGAAKDLADALRKGLEKLSPEERKRLAENLRERAQRGGASGKMSPKARKKLEDLAKKLKTPEGQKELEDQLRELAEEPSGGDDERREEGLDDADEGTDDAGKELGEDKGKKGKSGNKGKNGKNGKKPGAGKPPSSPGDGQEGDDGDGDGDGNGTGEADGPPIPIDGNGPGGGGDGDHKGKTKRLDAESLKAKAKGLGAKGTPKPMGGKLHGPGGDGATATVGATGDPTAAAASEINGVDKADVPEAVRRQVKAYFE